MGTVFAGSVHIAQDICPGQSCDIDEGLLLDYNEKEGQCDCIKHPCLNLLNDDGVHMISDDFGVVLKDEGSACSCSDPQFPILTYHYDEQGKLQCGCSVDYAPPKED